MPDSVRISFTDVAKRYDLRVVFKSISGQVSPGEVLVITGPNGSGKSTLLAILCGLLRPTRGTVKHVLDGSEAVRGAWRHHLGVVAPAMAVYEELDAMENLLFFARVRGIGSADARCRECLDLVGLDLGRRTPVRGYSTGMSQRLKIAQALLHDPAVLFLDEPGSNLDPAGKAWLGEYVRGLAAAGKTVVLATNDRDEMKWGHHRVALAG
jgi:heme exporter protein A